jgi:hypothetical protein
MIFVKLVDEELALAGQTGQIEHAPHVQLHRGDEAPMCTTTGLPYPVPSNPDKTDMTLCGKICLNCH